MRELTLVDKKNKEHRFLLPEELNEMTEKQLCFLASQVDKSLPVQEIKIKMLLFCMNGRLKIKLPWHDEHYYRVKAKGTIFKLTAENMHEASTLFDYLFTEPDKDGNCFFDNRLSVCPFEKVRVLWFFSFCVPERELTNVTYDQYIFLESYFDRIEAEPEYAYAFLGALLTRPGKKFDKNRLYLRLMRHVSPKKMVLLIWFFIGSVRFIADKFPRIFPAGSGDGKRSSSLYDSQQRLLDFMTKADTSKKLTIKENGLYEALYSLDYILEQQEKKNT